MKESRATETESMHQKGFDRWGGNEKDQSGREGDRKKEQNIQERELR